MPTSPQIRLATAVLAVGGGLLTNAACPDLSWWAAAFPGVALLVLALEPDSARWGFVTGTLFGLGFFLPHLIWADSAVGWIPWVALSLVQALFCGALGIAWVWARRLPAVWRSPWFRSIVFAVLWVAFEYGRSIWPFGGFPWGRLATSQADSPLARLAWLGGVPLVSGAAAWAGALLAQAVIALRRWRVGRASGLVLGVAALIVAALFVPLDTRAESGSLAVGAVQGNVPVPGLDAFAQQRQVLHNHALGTRALAERPNPTPLDLVLWPENGSDIDPRTDAPAATEIDDAAATVGAPILVGTIEYPSTGGRYNTSLLWEPGQGSVAVYRKQHPVPFAEYIPMRAFARTFSHEVDRVNTDMIAGHGVGLIEVPVPRLNRNVPIGDVICFEVGYDDLVLDSVLSGAEMLVVQTNNASFGRTAESTQQLALSRLRAIEFGRTTIQISTVGVSAVITPSGHVVQQTGLFTAEELLAQAPLRTSITPAAHLGPWLSWLFCGAAAVFLIAGFAGASRVRREVRVRD